MKRIEAVIAHDLIQDVEKALVRSGIEGLTLTSVYSNQMQGSDMSASRRDLMFGVPCCKLDVLVADGDLSKVLSALIGFIDPRMQMPICVMDLEVTIRIRTGESQEAALR